MSGKWTTMGKGGKKRSGSRRKSNAMPSAMSPDETVSVRKISNGYIVSRSGMKGKQYVHTETFSEEKPVLEIAKA